MLIKIFIDWLKLNKWNVIENKNDIDLELIRENLIKYHFLDDTYLNFISKVTRCSNEAHTVWFNCISEYIGDSEIVFRWNEFEAMSLDAAEGDNDWKEDIKYFWNNNIPIIMSVENGYSYYALNNEGRVVYGFEPEFEEPQIIADSFDKFIKLVMDNEIILTKS